MIYTHQSEKADLLSFFLSSSFSCFISWSLLSASLCFLYFSLSRRSCSCFHFSNTCNDNNLTDYLANITPSHRCFPTISFRSMHNKSTTYLCSRLIFFFSLFNSSFLFSNQILFFFGFCFEALGFLFFPGLIWRNSIFLFSFFFLFDFLKDKQCAYKLNKHMFLLVFRGGLLYCSSCC